MKATNIINENDYVKFFQEVLWHNEYFREAKLNITENKTAPYKSITISLPGNVYRMNKKNLFFIRLKTTGKIKYIGFKKKYLYWFEKHGIPYSEIKSDEGFFRILLEDFPRIMQYGESGELIDLVGEMFLDAVNFESFGCCNKYVECSNAKKCLHEDFLYSTACMYRKNLEKNKIFYGINKNM